MRLAFYSVVLVLLATLVISLGLAVAQPPTPAGEMPAVQRYVPDQQPPWRPDWQPDPDRVRTVYAERVVLKGPRCEVVIDATGNAPGLSIRDLRTGQRCVLYLDARGQAAMGVSTPARRELAAGLFTGNRMGCVQLSDANGVHVFTGRELGARGFGQLQE